MGLGTLGELQEWTERLLEEEVLRASALLLLCDLQLLPGFMLFPALGSQEPFGKPLPATEVMEVMGKACEAVAPCPLEYAGVELFPTSVGWESSFPTLPPCPSLRWSVRQALPSP